MESIFSVILLFLSITSMFVLVRFIIKDQDYIRTNAVGIKQYDAFYYEFKCDKGLFSMFYYPFFMLRRLFFILGLYFLEDLPLFQVFMNSILSALTVLYLIVYKPYKSFASGIINLVSESIVTLVFIMTGFFLMDFSDSGIKITIQIIMLCVISISFVGLIVFVVMSVFYVKRIWKKKRDSKICLEIDTVKSPEATESKIEQLEVSKEESVIMESIQDLSVISLDN